MSGKGRNPFPTTIIPVAAPLCDRQEDLDLLLARAASTSLTTIYSPRRFGKTTLVLHVQDRFNRQGNLAIYVDLFRVTSVEEIARRLAKSVYTAIHAKMNLVERTAKVVQKIFTTIRPVFRTTDSGSFEIGIESSRPSLSGVDVLESVLEDLGKFIAEREYRVNIALDEFQDIIDLKDGSVEGILRSHLQRQGASYFMIGSRRHLLLAMFNDKTRPFFQSSFLHQVRPLPLADLTDYLVERFSSAGLSCSESSADLLATLSKGHPHYAQKMASMVFDLAKNTVDENVVRSAEAFLLQEQRPLFEAYIQGLTLIQVKVLRAIAMTPTSAPYSKDFLSGLNVSISAVQNSMKVLTDLDHINKDENGVYLVTDPFFSRWLAELN